MTRGNVVFVLVILASLALAGCPKDDQAADADASTTAPKDGDAGAAEDKPKAKPAEATRVTFGILPPKRGETTTDEELVGAFANLLSEATGKKLDVDVKIVESYEALITALGAGTVDFALMDGGGGWLAHKESGARAILAEADDADSKPFYQAVAFVHKDLFAGDWDHDKTPKTEAKKQICHIAQTKGRISAHTSLTGSAGMIMPLGFMLQEKLVNIEDAEKQNDTTAIDALLAQWFSGYILGKGGSGGTHDVTAKLPSNYRDVYGNHYANAFYHAHKGNADVAFVSGATPTEKFEAKDHEWTTKDMVTIQVRGEFPKNDKGEPDCAKITDPEYRKANADRFSFGKVPSHPVMVGKHVKPEVVEQFTAAMLTINKAGEDNKLATAWKAIHGKSGVTRVETKDHLADIGQKVELVPGVRAKVKGKKKL